MTKHVHKPAGWWQDNKGRMQPPGSFQNPSLRVPSESPRDQSAALSRGAASLVFPGEPRQHAVKGLRTPLKSPTVE